jgi:hypothetical protein
LARKAWSEYLKFVANLQRITREKFPGGHTPAAFAL